MFFFLLKIFDFFWIFIDKFVFVVIILEDDVWFVLIWDCIFDLVIDMIIWFIVLIVLLIRCEWILEKFVLIVGIYIG